MVAALMKLRNISAVVVGADRVSTTTFTLKPLHPHIQNPKNTLRCVYVLEVYLLLLIALVLGFLLMCFLGLHCVNVLTLAIFITITPPMLYVCIECNILYCMKPKAVYNTSKFFYLMVKGM